MVRTALLGAIFALAGCGPDAPSTVNNPNPAANVKPTTTVDNTPVTTPDNDHNGSTEVQPPVEDPPDSCPADPPYFAGMHLSCAATDVVLEQNEDCTWKGVGLLPPTEGEPLFWTASGDFLRTDTEQVDCHPMDQ